MAYKADQSRTQD